MQKIGFCERYMLTTAVLNRTKGMTRRLEKALECAVTEYEKKWGKPFSIVSQYYDKGFDKIGICTPNEPIYLSTRYKLGEVVAVAQAYKDIFHPLDWVNREIYEKGKGWNNKLFVKPDLMKHRIQMTGVRIERLQAISDEDCLKEGVIQRAHPFVKEAKDVYVCPNLEGYYTHPRGCFAALINRPGVGRKGLWESNPFVVVYEFKLEK